MSPYVLARVNFEDYPPLTTLSFDEFVIAWARKHYVLSTPDVFALIKPVCREDPPEQMWSPHYVSEGKPDTWLFFLFAGDPREAWPSMPYLLPYVMWHRSKKAQTYILPIEQFWRKFINSHG